MHKNNVPDVKARKKRFNVEYHYLTKMRVIFLSVILIEEIIYWWYTDFKIGILRKVFYLTEWAHFFTIIFYFIMVTKKYDKKNTNKFSFFMQLTLSLQFLIVIVYWFFLHKIALEKVENQNLIYILYTKHIFPPLFLLADFLLNNLVFQNSKKKHFYFILFYGVYLMIITVYLEINIYPIFTFYNLKTYLLLFGCAVSLILFEHLTLKIQDFKFLDKKLKFK
jgi:hypothetical protein